MSSDVALVLGVLGVTVLLFVTEALRVDVVAMLVLLALAFLGLVTPPQALTGFSSSAVVSVIAVMILGYGLQHAGVTRAIARPLVRHAAANPGRLLSMIMLTVGTLSAFLQNVGAAALFLPAVTRIARSAGQAVSRLLMPMGFAAILGGTMSMIGSSPLILLNDMLERDGHARFDLFAVTPIGLALLLTGLVYFRLFGRLMLPVTRVRDPTVRRQKELITAWHISTGIHELRVRGDSPLVGKTREEVPFLEEHNLHLLAIKEKGEFLWAPWRHTRLAAGQRLALMGRKEDAEKAAERFDLHLRTKGHRFDELTGTADAGYAEIIVAPRSEIIGKTLIDFGIRKRCGVEPLVLFSDGHERSDDFSDHVLQAGDTIVVHGPWEHLRAIRRGREFVLATPTLEEPIEPAKGTLATLCFLMAITLALSGLTSLPLALLSGAMAMIVTRVIDVDDAYHAVQWQTVFLLAGLIPLGIAMDQTGAASWLAGGVAEALNGAHPLLTLGAFGVMATVFSLFMSNVAATVLLAPLAMDFAALTGQPPRAYALLVGVCVANSFLLPTHQVNALLMGPGGYRNRDYLRAGGVMTLLFLLVAVGGVYAMLT